jgi:hypothetical protein
VYVALTMRYEYLVNCSAFQGLPEALNTSQYLIPRLTRDQRQEAIEGPLRLVGVRASARLVQAILNEAGDDDPYQLPVLQHALLRTFLRWREAGGTGDVDLDHSERAGRLGRALDGHANEILGRLEPGDRQTAERIFRCLTVTDEDGRVTRRRRTISRLVEVLAEDRTTIERIVDRFTAPADSLLLWSPALPGAPPEVDISHESLIARWDRLGGWVKAEARNADRYRDLARSTLQRDAGEGGLWRDPELARALRRAREEKWNASWAAQYWPDGEPPTFAHTQDFLETSRRRQALYRGVLAALACLLVLLGVMALYYRFREHNARAEATEARARMADAEAARAEAATASARAEKRLADAAGNVSQLTQRLADANPAQREAIEKQLAAARAEAQREKQNAEAKRAELDKLASSAAAGTSEVARLKNELEEAKQAGSRSAQQLRASQQERDDWKARAEKAEAASVPAQATPSSRYPPIPSLRKPEDGLAWFDYLDLGHRELEQRRPAAALVYLYAAAALHPRSTLDDGSNRNRSYFPHYEIARALAALGDGAGAQREIALEEEAGEIRKSTAFSQRLDALKAQLSSGTSSAK